MSRRLLVVRPEPGATRTVQRARAMGLHAVACPLFIISRIEWTAPDPALFDALLLTSANTLRHAGPQIEDYRHLPAFAVGEATAEAARQAGLAVVATGVADAQAFLPTLAPLGHHRILHLAGRDVRLFDPGALQVTHICVYAAVESDDTASLDAVADQGGIALVHSARAARRLADLLPMTMRRAWDLVAISQPVLAAAGPGWASGQAADHPEDNALLALAAGLCD